MPTYPTYKLGEIAKIYNGNSINAEEKEKKYKGVDGRNYIGTKDIEFDCSVNYSNGVRIPFDEKKFRIAPKGSVLVCAEGGSAGKKSAFITEDVCFGNKLFAITNNQGLFDGKYVFYYTRYKRFFDLFKNELSGLIGGVSSKKFGEIPIPLPPLPTQQAIVSRIETLFAELDKAVQHLRTAQQQIKTYRQTVLNHWLNNDDGKWEMVNISCFLDNSCKGMMTGPFGTALKKSEHKSCGIPVLGIENIGEGSFVMPNKIFVTEEKAKELKTFAVKTDDIIISRSGTVGEICKVPFFMNDALLSTNLIRIRLNLDLINADYFVLLFQSSQIKQQVKDLCKGTTRAFLNQTILSQISFPFPPLSEQQRIVAEIESRLSQAEAVEASIERALQQAEALRQSILKKAFNGELI